ncbi:MAG: ABC transporter permease [Clostridia bacterium]|nr:ABC transporter permease [Clostridia bacterium]
MPTIRRILRRLFFYSSRQLNRRRRSYLSIFLTSVVLLALVMTFLEMAESTILRSIEQSESGYHHVMIRGMANDHTPEILKYKKIESAWSIPYTSMLASSDDASKPARVAVPTEEIYDRLDVRYVWGREPEDGEIAVSTELYNAYSYLIAGAENELYFSATDMTYFPLTVSGIFEANDVDAGYVFVTQKTADAIDAETRAKTKYDLYFRCKYNSDRNIAIIIDDIFKDLRIPETDFQQFTELNDRDKLNTKYTQLLKWYGEYINTPYLDYLESQSTAPVIAISMPVIAVAALMMASFMANWFASNSEEYGILGAIGANRRQICAISAGQILLIGLIASVPVILISAGISNIYISAYNAASATDVDYVFSVPWLRLIEASLWWCVLACFFSYIGIARITMELPFVLISGQAKYRIPYVSRSSEKLKTAKDKILTLSLLKARRTLKSRIVTAVITSLVCIVCGVFVTVMVMFRADASSAIEKLNKYAADITVAERDENNSYGRYAPLTEELALELEKEPLIEKIALYDSVTANDLERSSELRAMDVGDTITQHYPYVSTPDGGTAPGYNAVITMNRSALDMASFAVIDGDPYRIFEDPSCMIAVVSGNEGDPIEVGEKFSVNGTQIVTKYEGTNNGYTYTDTRVKQTDSYEYTVCAVVVAVGRYEDLLISDGIWIMSDEGRQLCGLEGGQWSKVLGWFTEDAPLDELRVMYENLVNSPAFLRYDVTARDVQTESEERIQTANTVMLCFFFAMLYLSFCTMTYTDSFLKVTKERREIAILRQIGADDKAIQKSMRAETYPTVIVALCISLAVVLLIPTIYTTIEVAGLRATADYEKWAPEVTERLVDEIIQTGLMMYALLAPSIPVHFLSAGVTVLGTYLPTKRILKDTIAEGIRKDTD